MLRTWDTNFHLDFASPRAMYLQIGQLLVEDIRKGRLAPGTPLPGSRELARQLGVNRKTVVLAYEELVAQGWLEAQHKRGTFVSGKIPQSRPQPFARPGAQPTGGTAAAEFSWRELPPYERVPRAGRLVFDDVPDARSVPIPALTRAYRRALQQPAQRNGLTYHAPQGHPQLRQALAHMLAHDRGLPTHPDDICITRGSQMALYLAATLLLRPGDVAAVEDPGYPAARRTFELLGAAVAAVPVDAEGLRVEALEELCQRRPVRVLYVTPHHQFPTTVTLKADRRLRLLALAARYGFVIIEDDYDHEFHYRYQPLLPLAAADSPGRVVYIGSLSKLLAPGLRLGYITGPRAFIASVASLRALIDRQGDTPMEQAVAELMTEGEIKRHARKMQGEYLRRRDALAECLHRHLPGQAEFAVPEGGLALWVKFGADANTAHLAEALTARGVAILPGHHYFFDAGVSNAVRLGYASVTVEEIERGVLALQAALPASEPAPGSTAATRSGTT